MHDRQQQKLVKFKLVLMFQDCGAINKTVGDDTFTPSLPDVHTYGAKGSLACPIGYRVSGDGMTNANTSMDTECLDSGLWSNLQTKCEKKGTS